MMAQRSSLVNITVKGMLFLLLLVHQGRIGLALAAGSSEELADGQKESEDPCKLISEGNQIKKQTILCIGRITGYIVVVTQTLKVWMLNSSAVTEDKDGYINKLYFGTAPPIPITEQWPKLAENEWWKDILDIPSCNTATDAESDYLLLDSKKSQAINGSIGFGWDLKNNKLVTGFQNSHEDLRTRWIGNNDLTAFYAFTDSQKDSEGIRIVRYGLCNQTTKTLTSLLREGNAMGAVSDDDPTKCNITGDPNWYYLCLDGTSGVYVKKTGKCEKPATWALYNGFVDKGRFYLFGDDAVYSFEEKAYQQSSKSTVRTIDYSKFIQCSGSGKARDDKAQKSPLTIGLIVAASLILVLLLLCCLLCLVREAMARQQRKNTSKKGGKSTSKGGGGALIPGFPGVSARSKDIMPFGFITGAKNSKSKRSKGVSLGAAGTLSKKAVGQMTKRSEGLPLPGTATSVSGKKGMLSTKRSKGRQAVSGKDITAVPNTGKGAASLSVSQRVTNRSKAVSTKQTSQKRSGGSKKRSGGGVGGASFSNKATERSKLKKKR